MGGLGSGTGRKVLGAELVLPGSPHIKGHVVHSRHRLGSFVRDVLSERKITVRWHKVNSCKGPDARSARAKVS